MTAVRFVVELRPPRKGEHYVIDDESIGVRTEEAEFDQITDRWVIVDPPGRCVGDPSSMHSHGYKQGWNDCLEELLTPPVDPVPADPAE